MRGSKLQTAYEMRREIDHLRGPNGRPLCTLCREEVPAGRRTWCSQTCVDLYIEDSNWTLLRRKVRQRDRGICAICGLDTRKLKRRYRKLLKWFRARGGSAGLLRGAWADKYGIPYRRLKGDLWDADHIVPICEGGPNQLSNLRTLCIPCHHAETRKLKARRRTAE